MLKVLAVVLCVLALTGRAHADSAPHWTEVRSPHFVVLTDTNEKQGRHIAGQFERMRSLFSTLLPYAAANAGQPITVLAFRDRRGFQAVEPAVYLAKGSLDLAGLFLRTQDRNYILLRLDEQGEHPFATVYHEYTHYVLRKAEWLPIWLNEGLAEYYQNTDIHEKDVSLGQPSSDDILYLRQNNLIPLPVLFAVDHNSPYYHEEQKGSVFYSESWALTHFLEINDFDNKTHRLQDYANLLAKGGDPVASAQQAFGDLNVLSRQLAGYIQNSSYKLFSLKLAVTADEASFAARPLPTADADAIRADVLVNTERVPEAKTLIESVLRDNPRSALAHESMGYIAFREHDETAAAKWFGEAVELGANSPFASYFYARTLLESGASGKDDVIESSLRQSLQLDPTFAPSYETLGRFYGMRHRNLQEAGTLIARAARLEPEEMSYRLNLANVYMEQDMADAALNVLTAAAKTAKTPQDKSILEARIADLQKFQAAKASYKNASTSTMEEVSIGPPPSSQPPSSGEDPAPGAATSHGSGPVHVTRLDPAPTLPPVPATAPHRSVRGIIRNTHCSYPSILTLDVEETAQPGKPSQPGKTLTLFAPDMFKLTFSVTYVTHTAIDPCQSLTGAKARIDYAEVTGDKMAGQLLAIQLSK